jgi:hypothetical protein
MAMAQKSKTQYETMMQSGVPQGRSGKHKGVVIQILQDIAQLKAGMAIRLPLKSLTESKAKVRAALNRATRKAGLKVRTASDEQFLYVWNE